MSKFYLYTCNKNDKPVFREDVKRQIHLRFTGVMYGA